MAVLEKMRDTPNAHLHSLSNEVALLTNKIGPILSRVEQAQSLVQQANAGNSLSSAPGPVGMLSKMGGRLIAFYADDLADALIEDLLMDAALDMNKIEAKEKDKYAQKETE